MEEGREGAFIIRGSRQYGLRVRRSDLATPFGSGYFWWRPGQPNPKEKELREPQFRKTHLRSKFILSHFRVQRLGQREREEKEGKRERKLEFCTSNYTAVRDIHSLITAVYFAALRPLPALIHLMAPSYSPTCQSSVT
jgi:hypothetical protein